MTALTVVIPAHDEAPNLAILLPRLRQVLGSLEVLSEILLVTRQPDSQTAEIAARYAAKVVQQREGGYGGALQTGFEMAQGTFVLTMDADLSHSPDFVVDLWRERYSADVVIASRYTPGGSAQMRWSRRLLSRILNRFFTRGLSLPIRDLSSGFRLYNADVLRTERLVSKDFDVLQEILVKAIADGRNVKEVPFRYEPRAHGSSNARVIPFGIAYLRTFARLWRLRNSILCADYDDRAFDSLVLPQRYWQRRRFRHITELLSPKTRTLDVGCGSSRIISSLHRSSVAIDVSPRKLRYAKRFGRQLVRASGFGLPFRDGVFSCVLCSQVIEHVPRDPTILTELSRVLAPGGRLVLGTPDYGGWQWPLIEAVYARVAPGGYADEHITHYTRQELIDFFLIRGYIVEEVRYILRAELILALRKPALHGDAERLRARP